MEAEGVSAKRVAGEATQKIPHSKPASSFDDEITHSPGEYQVIRRNSKVTAFDPAKISYEELLRIFWESHDPTQGMRQGNDVGTQYRSAIYTYSQAQREAAQASREAFQQRLREAGYGEITTEIREAPELYYAEDYHQQYLAKNPGGYCGLGGTGVSCPVGVAKIDA